jgi:hypothetical protein
MSFIDHNMEEYLEAYRINFKNWRIVDIDNFMGGNPFFSQIKEERVWEKEVLEICGGEDAKSNYISDTGPANEIGLNVNQSNRKQYDKVMRAFAHNLQELDTTSNRVMSPLHKRRANMVLERDDKAAWEVEQ